MPELSVRETPNTWRVAVRPKPKGTVRWGMLKLGKGIIVARFRREGDKDWQSQSVIFPKDRYSREDAVAWVRKHRGEHGIAAGNPETRGPDKPGKWLVTWATFGTLGEGQTFAARFDAMARVRELADDVTVKPGTIKVRQVKKEE